MSTVATDSPVDAATQFLSVVFEPGDIVNFRPVETWTEDGKKQSLVDYKGIRHEFLGIRDSQSGEWQPHDGQLLRTLESVAKRSETELTNTFFGVCPRFRGKGQFDLAWQIRTVRVLWADVDDTDDVDDVLQRCKDAGLPGPSIIVHSGNGLHLYWLLDQPYLIDDVDDPPAVLTEWIEKDGRHRPRKYILGDGDAKLYLDIRANVPELSEKAQWITDVLQGIAHSISGDHTFDLARLLRVPGTLNRKNQRNGQEPKPSRLLKCEVNERHSIDLFERFAEKSPGKKQREQIAKIPLPAPKRKSGKRKDRFADLLASCVAAPLGKRSEADYAIVCFAIEHGMDRGEVWEQVASVGKFAEGGEAYFDRTWEKAAQHTREKIFARAEAKANSKAPAEDGDFRESFEIEAFMLADTICEKNHFAVDAGGKLHRFADGVYQPDAEQFVKREVKRLCRLWKAADQWSTTLAKETYEFIRVDATALWDRPPLDKINLKNGLLRVADQILLPHDPEFLSVVQFPVTYDPKATCPAVEKFAGEVLPDDAADLLFIIIAWLMLPDTSIQQAILLTGEGSNGKSTLLKLIIAFLGGHKYISGATLHKLEADRFAITTLYNKLANIAADLPSKDLAGTSVFKAVTGGDLLEAEYKFGRPFQFVPYCRLLFSANHPPRSGDASYAFFRRWLVIPFTRTFEGNAATDSKTLDAKLSAPSELSGILNRALEVLPKIQGVNRLPAPESCQMAHKEFHATTAPLAIWLDQHTIESPDAYVPCDDLIAAYNEDAKRENRPGLSKTAFGNEMKRLRKDVGRKQRTIAGHKPARPWCYVGLGLTQDAHSSGDPNCVHDYVDSEDEDGWIVTKCWKCSKFYGRRRQEDF